MDDPYMHWTFSALKSGDFSLTGLAGMQGGEVHRGASMVSGTTTGRAGLVWFH
jgi:hypothetical protein